MSLSSVKQMSLRAGVRAQLLFQTNLPGFRTRFASGHFLICRCPDRDAGDVVMGDQAFGKHGVEMDEAVARVAEAAKGQIGFVSEAGRQGGRFRGGGRGERPGGKKDCNAQMCGVNCTTWKLIKVNIMKFGELIKDLRIAKELSLRQCCIEIKADPSNWSKMERGIAPPPKDAKLLESWAKFFGLADDQKREFLDLAALARQEIPADMASDETVIAALPAFFRAVRGHELEGDRLLRFVEDLRAVHSPSKANTR
jgi:transcriptional regulator with XRE-family HTH domain